MDASILAAFIKPIAINKVDCYCAVKTKDGFFHVLQYNCSDISNYDLYLLLTYGKKVAFEQARSIFPVLCEIMKYDHGVIEETRLPEQPTVSASLQELSASVSEAIFQLPDEIRIPALEKLAALREMTKNAIIKTTLSHDSSR